MRRLVIFGLIGLLIFVILLDFEPTAHDPITTPLPTAALVAAIPPTAIVAPPAAAPLDAVVVAIAPTTTIIPGSPTIPFTPTATLIPNLTRDAVVMTLTQMQIDATGSAPPPPTYTLQSGDTLFRVATQYGVTVDAIMRANNVTDPTRLHVGQVLLIPVGIAPELVQPLVTAPPTMVAFANAPVPTATRIPFEQGNITPVFGPPPPLINGIAFESVIVLPENVRQNIHTIFSQGQALGNNPRAFSKLGDSTIEHPYFLGRFDDGPYNLGAYGYLKGAIDYFSGSFRRESVAVRRGLHTWSVLDPMWAPKPACNPGEHMLACEFRLNRPSILFIRLGSNDAGIPETTDENLREIIEYSLANGVIPVLGTKADRHEGPSDINNAIIRQVAADYQIPLWDFDLIAQTMPGRGLDQDGVHLTTFYAHDYTRPEALQRGYGVYNLTALMMLDMIWRETITTKV